MTPTEIQILVCGVLIGAYLVIALHAFWGWRDAQCNLQASRRLRRVREADHFFDSLWTYQMQQKLKALR
ncbi:hypothetical protein ACFC08_35650 [Streptomyces sp. NPDC056112]|uniref:hypothetical protein n=1 Tax=Streptomyces sp. NPDC056112 TaxID=3345715 RepID=UPI0035DAFA89